MNIFEEKKVEPTLEMGSDERSGQFRQLFGSLDKKN
jgi:hypothetical protein